MCQIRAVVIWSARYLGSSTSLGSPTSANGARGCRCQDLPLLMLFCAKCELETLPRSQRDYTTAVEEQNTGDAPTIVAVKHASIIVTTHDQPDTGDSVLGKLDSIATYRNVQQR